MPLSIYALLFRVNVLKSPLAAVVILPAGTLIQDGLTAIKKLLNGVPIESVSKMLGHNNIRTTQHYAKILDIKVGEDKINIIQNKPSFRRLVNCKSFPISVLQLS